MQPGKARSDRLTSGIEQARAERRERTRAAIGGRAAAQPEIDFCCPRLHSVERHLAHAVRARRERGLVRARGARDARSLGHLHHRFGATLTRKQQIACLERLAHRARHRNGAHLSARGRVHGIDRALAAVRDGQTAHPGRRACARNALGYPALYLRARGASLKGVDGEQHVRSRNKGLLIAAAARGASGLGDFRSLPTTDPLCTQLRKEGAQQLAAFVFKHARRDGKGVVQACIAVETIERTQRPALGVGRAVHAAVDTRVHHQTRAHKAGFERHVDGAAAQAPTAQRRGCPRHGRELRMGRRVRIGLTAVMRTRHDLTVADHHGTDGHLALARRRLRLGQRLAHKELVIAVLLHLGPFLPAFCDSMLSLSPTERWLSGLKRRS